MANEPENGGGIGMARNDVSRELLPRVVVGTDSL